MADLHYWLGSATRTRAIVVCRSDTNGTINLIVNGSTYSKTVSTGENDGVVFIEATGLASDTSYTFTLDLDGEDVQEGQLRTMPESGTVFSMAYGSCMGTGVGMSMDGDMLARDIRMLFLMGDTPYTDFGFPNTKYGITTIDTDSDDSLINYYKHQQRFTLEPGIKDIRKLVPTVMGADDHEYWDNCDHSIASSQITSPARNYANQGEVDAAWWRANRAVIAYHQGNPVNTDVLAVPEKPASAEASTSVDNYPVQYFINRVNDDIEIFKIDCISARSPYLDTDDASKYMLGPNQEAALLAGLRNSTAEFKLIVSSKPTMTFSTAGSNTDSFISYQTQFRRIAQYIHDQGITGVLWTGGDQHNFMIIEQDVANGDAFNHACHSACALSVISTNVGFPDSYVRETYQRGNCYGVVEVHPGKYLRVYGVTHTGEEFGEAYLDSGSNNFRYIEPEVSL